MEHSLSQDAYRYLIPKGSRSDGTRNKKDYLSTVSTYSCVTIIL